jgi:hypothetical protein
LGDIGTTTQRYGCGFRGKQRFAERKYSMLLLKYFPVYASFSRNGRVGMNKLVSTGFFARCLGANLFFRLAQSFYYDGESPHDPWR